MNELRIDNSIPESALIVMAHPDDIEFGVAGTVARWVEGGARVTFALLTDGAAGSNDPDTDLQELITIRQQEQRAAAAILGVEDVRFLGYPDGMLEANSEVRKAVTRLIRELKPERVVCQDPETIFRGDRYINHPDHRAAGLNTIYAVFPSSETRPAFPELVDEGYEPHKVTELWMTLTNHADTVVDISPYLDAKIDALKAHKSQLGDGEWLRERIGKWNAEQAEPYDFDYAEGFRVMRLRQWEEESTMIETEGHAEEV